MYLKAKEIIRQYYRWVVWGTLFISFPIVHFQRLALGVVREELTGTFVLSSIAFANLGSIYFYIYALMQIPAGLLADTVGVRITVSVGLALAGIGSIIFGYAPGIGLLYLGRFLVGLGLSVVFVSIMKTQTQWFKENEFGTLAGLTTFIGNIGGLMAQTPFALLVALLTWRLSFAVIGAYTFILAIFCYLFVRNSPGELEHAPSHQRRPNWNIKRVFLNSGSWISFLVFAGLNGSFISIVSIWGTSYIVDVYGLSKVEASNYILMALIGAAMGSMIIGRVSDVMRRRRLPVLIFGVLNVFCWLYLVVISGAKPPLSLMAPFMLVFGFSHVGFVLTHACAKEINPLELAGTATALVNMGGFLGAAVLPLILGFVFDRYETGIFPVVFVYQRAFLFCLASSVFAFLCSLFIKETYCRNTYQEN